MTARRLILLASFGSAALLLGAFAFQLAGYAPCQMCLWQRWPHGIAVAVGAAVLVGAPLALAWLGGLAAAATSGIGVFHAGVEWRWWEGPASCSGGGGLSGLSGADLLSTEAPAAVVMCDEIVWQFAGLSMAGWNAVLSATLCLLWLAALRRRRT